jgi:hypothetical protein
MERGAKQFRNGVKGRDAARSVLKDISLDE